jgi:MFS family permease
VALADTRGTSVAAHAFRSDAYAWWVVAVLCLAAVVSGMDRQIISLLVEPIKRDLGLSDVAISLLQGAAFALFHSVAAVPLGRLADVSNRRLIILGGVLTWTLACVGSGLAGGFLTLFAMRMLIGAGEATLSPAGYSMLADYFPRDQLGRAISLFIGSGFVGSGLALIVGGAIMGQLSAAESVTYPLVGTLRPWQAAFVLVALPGFLVLALLLTVREPPRSSFGVRAAAATAPAPPFRDVLRFIVAERRTIGAIYAGFALLAAMQFGLGAWVPAFFMRTHAWSAAEIGYAYGLNYVVVGTLGVLIGGAACDALARRGYADANLRVGLVAACCALPLVIAFPLVPDGRLAFALLVPATLFGTMPFGAGTAALPLLAPNRMRAQVVALYLLVAILVGQGLGPFYTAALTDYAFGDPARLRHSISIAAGTLLAAAIAVLARGLPHVAASLARARG